MTVVDRFVEWAHAGLAQSEEAQQYLLGRGVSAEQWARHRIGYIIGDYHPDCRSDPGHNEYCGDREAQGKWCDSCRMARWSSVWEDREEGPRRQIVGRKLVGSVVMPLTSYSGALVGFQTRSIRGKAFDSFSLAKRPEGYFFGVAPNMDVIWARRRAVAVEGPFDQLVVERLVTRNVVGLTTNTTNSGQTRFFRRFVDEVGLLLDEDPAGRDGAASTRLKLDGGPGVQDVRFDVKSPKGEKCKDPNEAWKALGDDRFARYFTRLLESY